MEQTATYICLTGMCYQTPPHHQMQHSPSEIGRLPRICSADAHHCLWCICKKIWVFHLLCCHVVQHKLNIATFYLFLLLQCNMVIQITRYKSSLAETTSLLLHHIHYMMCVKSTNRVLNDIRLLWVVQATMRPQER
uniref:Uncharacterized protein n=1 Tax=Triticum urartu TaxID=4572 RepID=A0A8R7VI50_TRIUA